MSKEGVTERALPESRGDEHGAEDAGGQGASAGEPAAVPASPSSVTDGAARAAGYRGRSSDLDLARVVLSLERLLPEVRPELTERILEWLLRYPRRLRVPGQVPPRRQKVASALG